MKSKKKICKNCGKEFERKYRESFAYFDARNFCEKKCLSEYRRGENHPRWKGTKGNYYTIHSWVENNYKKSKVCSICGMIKSTRTHWALRKGYEYEKNINNFFELCGSCHRKYDMTDETKKRMSISAKRRLR